MPDEVKVTYRAVATFLSLKKAAAAARKDLQALEKQEAKTNKASVDGHKKSAAAILAHNKALRENLNLQKKLGSAAGEATNKIKGQASALAAAKKETAGVANVTKDVVKAEEALNSSIKKTAATTSGALGKFSQFRQRLRDVNKEQRAFIPLSGRVSNGTAKVLNSFRRLGNWRPRLTPPFVALLPLIGGLLALLNPLVSVLGAVGAAGFAAGAGLLSLGGVAIAIVPMLTAAITAVVSLISAFQGIGGAFSKWKAFKDIAGGGGGGGGGKSAADQAWDMMKAQERLTNAQERAADAQDELNDARKEAVRRLEDLRRAVQRASTDENQAAANAQLALENYYNVLADPGSTAGEKLDALAELQDAQQGVIDQQVEAKRNAEDLAEAEKKGVEGSDEVVAAQRNLRDALREVRDAAHDLEKTLGGSGGGGGAGGAMDEFQKALEKLSPSAQKFVLALIAMQPAWEAVQRTIQESFFSEFVDDMDELAGLLPTVENLLSKAAGAMGRLVHNFIQMVSSPEWKKDFAIISDQNVRLIDLAGAALLNLLTFMKDLTIAAGPFAEKVLGSFESLTKNLSTITADARESGSLADWLDVVYGRLQQWWRIVKNIAKTLFNYGAASAEFGQWITDGLERMTDNWLKASEEARKEDSPFKKWLEDIKPLLSEVRGLFGDFFGWLGDTAADEDSIQGAIDTLKIIREELGPALSSLLKTLTDSGIGPAFASTIASLVQSIEEIIAAGGDEGLKTFFDIVSGFFSWLADLFKDPVWGPMITELSKFAAAMAALSFIGKFTGLFALFGWILRLSKSANVMKLLTGIGGLGKSLAGVGGAAAAGGAGATGAAAGGAAAGGGLAALAAPLAIIAGAAIAIAGVSSSIATYAGAVEDNWGKITSGDFGQVREGLNDSAREGVKGLGPGQAASFIDGIFGTDLKGVWDDIVDTFYDDFVIPVQDAWLASIEEIATWWYDNVITPFSDFINGLVSWWNTNVGAPLLELWQTIKDIWNLRILPVWNAMVAWVQTNIFTPILNAWNTAISWIQTNVFAPIAGFFASVAAWVQTNVFVPITNFFRTVAAWVQTNVFAPITGFFAGVAAWVQTYVFAPIKSAFDGVVGFIRGAFSSIANFNPITAFNNWLRNTFKLGAVGGLVTKGAIGGVVGKAAQYLASGGGVRKLGDSRYNMDPKGTDTEPAMLTPGEYVVKKERVDEVGAANMQAFNDGMLSFSALMSKTRGAKGSSSVGYFDGGGLAGAPLSSFGLSKSAKGSAFGGAMVDNSMNFGDIHLHYPKRETGSDSLPRAIRSVAYQGKGRRARAPRLEGADV